MITIIFIITTIISIIFVNNTRKKIKKGEVSQDLFTQKEKVFVWILSFINPLIFGAIFYYTLIKRAPKKAKYANKVSFIALVILIALSFFTGFFDVYSS